MEKILVIDDEQDVCNILKEALEYEGYKVDFELSGEQALQKIQTNQYQAILVDIRLGGSTSGVDVIRSCGNLPQRPVVIVISATPKRLLDPIFEKEGILELVDKVLEKPSDLNPDVAPRLVKSVLEKHRKGRNNGE